MGFRDITLMLESQEEKNIDMEAGFRQGLIGIITYSLYDYGMGCLKQTSNDFAFFKGPAVLSSSAT